MSLEHIVLLWLGDMELEDYGDLIQRPLGLTLRYFGGPTVRELGSNDRASFQTLTDLI